MQLMMSNKETQVVGKNLEKNMRNKVKFCKRKER